MGARAADSDSSSRRAADQWPVSMTGTGEGDPPLSIGSEAKIYFIQILSIVYWQAIEMREREAGDRYLQ